MEHLASSLSNHTARIQKTYTLLPAYNEAEALATLVPRIAQILKTASRPFVIVVVNDGSTDQTSQALEALAREYAVRQLRHEVNRGYGAALNTGFGWIIQNAAQEDAAVTLDADNTQDPAYIPSLLHRLEEGYEAVTASYSMAGGRATGVPWSRRLMSRVVNALFRMRFRWKGIETYTNGFRAYRLSAIRRMAEQQTGSLIEESGFAGGSEFFIKVVGAGAKAGQIPFELHYEARGKASKIRLFSTIQRYVRLLVVGGRYVVS